MEEFFGMLFFFLFWENICCHCCRISRSIETHNVVVMPGLLLRSLYWLFVLPSGPGAVPLTIGHKLRHPMVNGRPKHAAECQRIVLPVWIMCGIENRWSSPRKKQVREREREYYEIDCTVSECRSRGSSANVRATPRSTARNFDWLRSNVNESESIHWIFVHEELAGVYSETYLFIDISWEMIKNNIRNCLKE